MSEQSPLERAARALWRTRADEFNDWNSLDGEERKALKLEARAVLLAIREPSEVLILAALKRDDLYDEVYHVSDFQKFFDAMIDAALEVSK